MRVFNKHFNSKLNPPVFIGANLILLCILGLFIISPFSAKSVFTHTQTWIVTNASWFYVLTVGTILATCLYLATSCYGVIKLGPDHSKPDYKNLSWFAMLFSTGMGIGLMFFGVAEPVMHYLNPPAGTPETIEAAKEAMKLTFFHWGLHAWGIYAIVGLILAYFSYRHHLPLTLRSALYPLIGDKIYGGWGHAVDIFAIVGTLFGVATTLGFGVLQINAGLQYLFGIEISTNTQVILIIITTCLATISVATGLDKGIKFLSELNLYLALFLLFFVLICGPTIYLLQAYVQNIGSYLSEIVNKTFNLYVYQPTDWLGGWTILYWGWWISWSPFVGIFIARISRGRTIREFLLGAMLIPAGFTLFWITVFGNSAVYMIYQENITEIGSVINTDSSLALFVFLEQLPFTRIFSCVAILMIVVFFVTSADSGALVLDMIASGGKRKTPVWQRIFWSLSIGIIAIVLLKADGLSALQTATIAAALPFSVILLISIYGLLKALKTDQVKRDIRNNAQAYLQPIVNSGGWQKRLHNLVIYPDRNDAVSFIKEIVWPAFQEVANELNKQGIKSKLTQIDDIQVKLEVEHGTYNNFIYAVKAKSYRRPQFVTIADNSESCEDTGDEIQEEQKYFRVEVYLDDGGKGHDIMGYTKDNISNDMIDQYSSHVYFIQSYPA